MTQEQSSTGNRDLEIAWAGGLFEGEGSFVLSVYRPSTKRNVTRTYKSATASISMCDLEPLERFQEAIGFGRMNGPYYPKQENHSRFWRWTIAGRQGVMDLLDLLEPYLSERRLTRAREIIAEDTSGQPFPSRRQPTPVGRKLLVELPQACIHGHAYDEDNTYINPAGGYDCRTCKRVRERERGRRIRSEARMRATDSTSD